MQKFDHRGVEVWKTLDVKVVVGKKVFPIHYRAKSGRAYNQAEIDREIERVIDHLDKTFPKLEFRQVTLLPNKFNFIAFRVRENQAENEHHDNCGEQDRKPI